MTVPTKAEGFEEVLLIKDINVDATTSDSTANKHEESFGPLKDRQALEGATPSTARRAALKTPPKLFPRPYRGQKLESTARPSPTYSEGNVQDSEIQLTNQYQRIFLQQKEKLISASPAQSEAKEAQP